MHLPIDPRTGITAIGVLPSGRVIWPIRGAAEEPTPTDSSAQEADPGEHFEFEPAGDLAVPADDAPEAEWKQYARKWQRLAQAKPASTDLRANPKYRDALAKAKKLDELESANATELEKAQKIAEQNETRAKTATERAVKAEVKALADGFQDKTDAVLRLGDLSRFVSDDGEIDDKAIAKELAEVLKNNEHLAKREPKPEPTRPGQRPTESLRPGAAPAEPERAGNLFDAIAGHYKT